jgi:hypothetical protein
MQPGVARCRRWLPVAAGLLLLAAIATDWPLGWSFWAGHPLVAAVTGGAVLLIFTGAVVDAYLQRREARRWQHIGHGAAHEFVNIFQSGGMALLQLLGYDWGEYCRADIEQPLRPARERAQRLLGASVDTDRDWNVA